MSSLEEEEEGTFLIFNEMIMLLKKKPKEFSFLLCAHESDDENE